MTKIYYSAPLLALCIFHPGNHWGTVAFSAPAPQNHGPNVGVRETGGNSAPFRSFPPDGNSMMTRYNYNMNPPPRNPGKASLMRPAPSKESLDGSGRIPMTTLQGGSRQTWSSPYNDGGKTQISLETEGRPMNADVELWQGPNNTPQRLKLYSEDGQMRPFKTWVNNPNAGNSGQSLSIRNRGPMEFPMNARVAKTDLSYGMEQQQQQQQQQRQQPWKRPTQLPDGQGFQTAAYQNMALSGGITVQGGALETFPCDPSVQSVEVCIYSEGMPVTAKIEIWQGPGRIAQVAEIYTDNGATKPFHAVVPTPGYGSTLVILNEGPMEYPLKVALKPLAESVHPEYDQPTNEGFYRNMISPGFRTIG